MKEIDSFICSIKEHMNYSFSDDLEYQKLLEAKKIQEEQNLPQGIWINEIKPIGWEEIESKSWTIMQKHGLNLKLFGLWIESYIVLHGIHELSFVFDVIFAVFETMQSNFLEDMDRIFSSIKYLDKIMAKVIVSSNLNFDKNHSITLLQFEHFCAENYDQFRESVSYITNNNAVKLHQNVKQINSIFIKLDDFLKHVYNSELLKTKNIIALLNNFLIYLDRMKNQDEEEMQIVKQVTYNKADAFKNLAESIEILEQTDSNSLILPLLKKALEWENLTILEILDDIGTAQQIEAFMKLIKQR